MQRSVVVSDAEYSRSWYLQGAILIGLCGAATAYAFALSPRDGVQLSHAVILGSLLSALGLIDVSTLRLPNPLTFGLGLAGLAVASVMPGPELAGRMAAILIGWGGMSLVSLAYLRFRDQEGLGMGDAKLVGAGGAWVGIDGLASVVLIGSCAALVAILVSSVCGRPHRAGARLAFGPYLALGIWLVWLLGPLA